MMQNGCSGPMTTVLDRDWMTVSTRLPLSLVGIPSRRQSAAMPASLRKLIRCRPATPGSASACSASSQATSKAASCWSAARSTRAIVAAGTEIPGTFSSMKRSAEALRTITTDGSSDTCSVSFARTASATNRSTRSGSKQSCSWRKRAPARAFFHARSTRLLERRRARVLDRAEEEVRRRIDRAAGEVAALRDPAGRREQLRAVEVEDAPRLGLVAGGDVVAGQAADVLDPVQRRADDLGLEREAVAVAADELETGSIAARLDRDRERRAAEACA